MKRLAIGAAVAGGTALVLHHLVPRVREMHARCREMMRTGRASGCQPESTPRCA